MKTWLSTIVQNKTPFKGVSCVFASRQNKNMVTLRSQIDNYVIVYKPIPNLKFGLQSPNQAHLPAAFKFMVVCDRLLS